MLDNKVNGQMFSYITNARAIFKTMACKSCVNSSEWMSNVKNLHVLHYISQDT